MTIEERLENMDRDLGRLKRRNRWLLSSILFVVGGMIFLGVFDLKAIRARSQEAGTVNDQVRQKVEQFVAGLPPAQTDQQVQKDLSQFVAGLPSAQALDQKEIRARKIIVEDEQSYYRAVLRVSEEGLALSMFDDNSKVSVGLGITKDGSGLTLADKKGVLRAVLGITKEGPGLEMFDEKFNRRAALGVTKDGPRLSLFDEKGKVIWSAIK